MDCKSQKQSTGQEIGSELAVAKYFGLLETVRILA